jgi:hypothetical protein
MRKECGRVDPQEPGFRSSARTGTKTDEYKQVFKVDVNQRIKTMRKKEQRFSQEIQFCEGEEIAILRPH